ncbi:MAG: chemotaxis-specific protein-glutamate methyltransferase CheB [Candidatus Manganitrophaceae bacterium]
MEKSTLSRQALKLLIVDDSSLFRQMTEALLSKHRHVKIVGLAEDGEKAMKLVVGQKPDVILLDLEMPRVDGFTFLRWLMAYFPTPVLVISSHSDGQSLFRALELGACDFYAKPPKGEALSARSAELISKIDILSKISRESLTKKYADPARSPKKEENVKVSRGRKERISHLLAIGASTGGPPALVEILSKLPEDFSVPIVVSQHMPSGFTKSFAERLNKLCRLQVTEVDGGERLEAGRVYLAPGGRHLLFEKIGSQVYTVVKTADNRDRYVPSVDLMIDSACEIFGEGVFGVLLTGMGDDGKIGLGKIKKAGGKTLAESEETAVVFGMPREAIEAGVVDQVVPLHRIAGEIIQYGRDLKK